MQQETLKLVVKTQKKLDTLPHPDSYRISKEIVEFTKGNESQISSITEQITLGKPWEYIKGEAEFLNNHFKVTPAVLIPRIETEEIVNQIIEDVNNSLSHTAQIIDVGTGSGAIVCSLAKALCRKDIEYIGTDISAKALQVARENIIKLNLSEYNIRLVKTNLIEAIEIANNSIVVANLPYIPTEEYLELDKSVKEYEPRTALDGGIDGSDKIIELLIQVSKTEEKPLKIYLEIDPKQTELLIEKFNYTLPSYTVEVIKDNFDRDRFIVATNDSN